MHDVIVAGAGPVGLLAADELALSGCSVLVLERDREPHPPLGELPLGLRGLNAGSAETFYRRGLLDAAMKASGADPRKVGADPDAVEVPDPRQLSHFAGMTLDPADIDTTVLPRRLPGPVMEGFMTSLAAVTTVLAERASALGVEIVRDAPVTAVGQDDEGVVVTAAGRQYRARYLVGCDGGRSAVRRLAGFDFVGTGPLFTGYVAEVTFAGPDRLPMGYNLTGTGMFLRTPFEGYLGMLDFDGGAFDRSGPLTREHLQSVLRRVSGTDVTLDDVHHASSFTDRAMQVTSYRNGRVLLAGDAAHIHSPLGGQGLNLGVGDAMNLGWKLAATLHGTAPEGLLDTYTTERHPVGAAVLDWSRAQVATMAPGPHAPALRRLVHDLMRTTDGTTHVHRRTSGLFHRYDLGENHPLAGSSAPDFCFEDGTRLGELLQTGHGVALDFTADQALRPTAQQWQGRIRYATGPVRDSLGFSALLVRPDGIVAWARESIPDAAEFENAATRWFGAAHR
ncbi:FAD-dependent monooxygenase [Streptomyces cellulosae]|uniref:FAD-dependent monooxygenase n=2 Tax=Streptomyces TaxID=1883 RepID=A0ABU3J0B6_9ACTN|nr:2-polyprenyl-6-methoxyphenol hydroxylase-like FAD-dependent oxidoreductase [Streptomyces thermodiastaticus]MDT6968505.1 FAD-dependent monooxygenase [Streptomyces thermocarboxydus]THC57097.1 FAD-dependent oxidoreductase [Streptomyces sp. Akac8]WSB44133.1 FAD-dependent monooxygenase [Streptomyces cellulosae]UVT12350.1 FAD-dependent monooxygenase [Streptomyces thermocarboxydus]